MPIPIGKRRGGEVQSNSFARIGEGKKSLSEREKKKE